MAGNLFPVLPNRLHAFFELYAVLAKSRHRLVEVERSEEAVPLSRPKKRGQGHFVKALCWSSIISSTFFWDLFMI